MVNKLTRLETIIKDKLSANWFSVRKAFLDLDLDYDGYVTVEDLMRILGEEGKDLDFTDLRKLVVEKDQKKRGKINYTDFSKWMGGVIQQSEGFYFRHDSRKNPPKTKKPSVFAPPELEQAALERTVLEKIKF